MGRLIFLIDPNDNNLDKVIEEINLVSPKHVWVGCSVSKGEDISNVFSKLIVPANLFPSKFEHIIKSKNLADKFFLSSPLFCDNPLYIQKLFEKVLVWCKEEIPGRVQLMNYILLNPNCTASKILGMARSPSDLEVLNYLKKSEVYPNIYLEGGSRNNFFGVAKRKNLIRQIKKIYPKSTIICGGGINSITQIRELMALDVDVLVSHMIHNNPKIVRKLIYLSE